MERLGARALQARFVEVVYAKSLLISCMRACKTRAPSRFHILVKT
jgi:hypothetical protein